MRVTLVRTRLSRIVEMYRATVALRHICLDCGELPQGRKTMQPIIGLVGVIGLALGYAVSSFVEWRKSKRDGEVATKAAESSGVPSYREPASAPTEGPLPLPEGPLGQCPACNKRYGIWTGPSWDRQWSYRDFPPQICSPRRRLPSGLLRRCKVPGFHLHQQCTACQAVWVRAPEEGAIYQ